MFSSLVTSIINGIHGVVTGQLFAPVVSFGIKILALYMGVWLIYGGMQIAAGKKSATELGWGIGKFVVLFSLLFSMGIMSSISGVIISQLSTPKQFGSTLDGMTAGFDTSFQAISRYWKSIPDIDSITNIPIDPDRNKGIKDAAKKAIEDDKYEQEQMAQAQYNQAIKDCDNLYGGIDGNIKEGLLDGLRFIATPFIGETKSDIAYCYDAAGNNLTATRSAINNAYQQALRGNTEELTKMGKKTKEKIDSEIARRNAEAKQNSDTGFKATIVNGLNSLVKIPFLMVAVLSAFFAAMFLFPLIFKILELIVNLVLTICFLAAAVPLAGMALLYGKWFKNIFDKWFGMFVHNLIALPIILVVFSGFMNVVTVSLSSPFGNKVGFTNFAQLIHGAIISGKIDDPNWMMKAGCLCVLFLGPKIISMMIDATTKFLDELLGGSLSSQSNGAISQMGSTAGAVGGGMMGVGLARGAGAMGRGAGKLATGAVGKVSGVIGGVANAGKEFLGATGEAAKHGLKGMGHLASRTARGVSSAMNKLRN